MTQLILILLVVGVLFILLVAAGGAGWFFLRSRGNKFEETKPAPPPAASPKKSKIRRIRPKAEKPAVHGNGTETVTDPSPSPDASAPPVPSPAVSSPSPSISVPDIEPLEEIGDKMKILIVDDNLGTRENVSRLLYFEKDMEVIGQATNGRHGIEMAVDHQPHIILMDINMPDMDGIAATEELSLRMPYSQVIIMSVQAEQHYMKQAMAAGARDFQPKPFTADELISCIRRVYDIGRPLYRQFELIQEAQAKGAAQTPEVDREQTGAAEALVIAVYSAKGGIGTSTIAVNLAAAFQQLEGEVALVDADLQFGDVSVHLNTQASRTIIDAIHNGEFDAELLPELMLAHNSGLKLLLAPTQPEMADSITPPMLVKSLKELKKQFKTVVVDVAKQLNDRSLSVLENADHILVVTAPELPAIKNAKLFLDLAVQLEIPVERIDVVMNHTKLPGGIPPSKIEKVLQISRSYQIPHDSRLGIATNKGVTVIQHDSGTPSAKAFMALARALREKDRVGNSEPLMKAIA